MENRFKEDRRLGTLIACVSLLIEAIARRDRWQIARAATGPLLEELLAGHYDDKFVTGDRPDHPGLQGVPIAVADDRVAIVVGSVPTDAEPRPIQVTAVLVARDCPRRWLVAALDFDMVADNDFQRQVQFGTFSEDMDLAVIAAHGTLDNEAAEIDWDDPTVVLRESESGTVTVADIVTELAKWDRSAWAWLAAERVTLSGHYLRAKHPELVREYPHH
ncbi:MAG: hypothetical protein EOP31_10250 [Rhodococcus sp. (in: high G+C Gram-positive bacteria)]|nr:MAG: hypothetical protein EOP31_10250 [Rhodococcus sp. (in: high G+C Gram-positive bacteria)]